MLPSEWDGSSPSASNSLSVPGLSPLSQGLRARTLLDHKWHLALSCLDLLSISVKEKSSLAGAISVRALG